MGETKLPASLYTPKKSRKACAWPDRDNEEDIEAQNLGNQRYGWGKASGIVLDAMQPISLTFDY